jgi:hypothetical protein
MNHRRIFNRTPGTWQELQNYVDQLFSEIGYKVEVTKTVDLVRGKKEKGTSYTFQKGTNKNLQI